MNLDTVTVPTFRRYPEIIAEAIKQLDSAIAVAQRTNFSLPVDSWLHVAMTRDQFIALANSFAALAYSPRTRAERAAVNWQEVIRRIDLGIKTDFAPVAQVDILWDDWKRLVARVRQTARPSDFAFQLRTKDRRIQGVGGPATPGTYVGYNQNDIFAASRGTYRFSHYYFRRYGTGNTWFEGPQPAMLVSEMDLLKAEALIRLARRRRCP